MRNLAAIKANAHYTCQECGATKLIQTHHRVPGDDSTISVLCAECHSKKHPDVPKTLFLSVLRQSYWVNKSAASLAKELNVCPRTVIRTAKRLKILPGDDLSAWDEELIRNNIPKLQLKQRAKKAKKARFLKTCAKCAYSWNALKPDPMYCPACGYWVHPIIIMPEITIDNIYETTEAAKLIGISYCTLYRWVKAGKLTPIRIAGRTLIPKSEVDRMKKEKAAES